MTAFAEARRNMVDCQLRTFEVSDRAILAAMDGLPREHFVPAGQENIAYLDRNLVLAGRAGEAAPGRVMLAPMVLARLIQELDIEPNVATLVVGGGLGYSAAILARLGATVTLLESRADLLDAAKTRFGDLGLGAIRLRSGPLQEGCEADRPFDTILIEGSVETRPDALLDQLVEGGRLACLTGDGHACKATIYVRAAGGFGSRVLFDASAPLLPEFRAAPAFVF